jgi:hypothetical protein
MPVVFQFRNGYLDGFSAIDGFEQEKLVYGQAKELISDGVLQDYADLALPFVVLRNLQVGPEFRIQFLSSAEGY